MVVRNQIPGSFLGFFQIPEVNDSLILKSICFSNTQKPTGITKKKSNTHPTLAIIIPKDALLSNIKNFGLL